MPIRVDNPNIGSGQKQLQRREQETTLFQQIRRPISFKEPNLLLPTIWVFRRSLVPRAWLTPAAASVTAWPSQCARIHHTQEHCHVLLWRAEQGVSLSCQFEEWANPDQTISHIRQVLLPIPVPKIFWEHQSLFFLQNTLLCLCNSFVMLHSALV